MYYVFAIDPELGEESGSQVIQTNNTTELNDAVASLLSDGFGLETIRVVEASNAKGVSFNVNS